MSDAPEDDVAFRRRAGNGPVFTATKCPPGPGLTNSCELPFGFIWTPMSPTTTTTTTTTASDTSTSTLPPVICTTCLGYMNLYSLVEESTGVWTCSLCGAQNVAPTDLFDANHHNNNNNNNVSLALVSPMVEYRQQVNTLPGQQPNSCSYILVLDANLPTNEVQAVVTQLQLLLLQKVEQQGSTTYCVQLALLVFDENVSIYQLGITGMASADVYYSIIANKYTEDVTEQQQQQEQEEELLQRRLRMEHRNYFVQVRTKDDLATLWLCLSAVYGIQVVQQQHTTGGGGSMHSGDSGDHPTLSRKEQLRLKKEARLRKQLSGSTLQDANDNTTTLQETTPIESPWISLNKIKNPSARCTGEATTCAVDLAIFGPSTELHSSRILLFTNGCPNVGAGSIVSPNNENVQEQQKSTVHLVDAHQLTRAVDYFQVTGKYAADNGIGIDVFCTGAESLGIPAFQALVKASEGYALSHDGFASPPLARNLEYIVSQTNMSIADCSSSDDENAPVEDPSTYHLEGCLADIRMSSFLTPTHIGGAGTIVEDDSSQGLLVNEKEAFAVGMECAAARGIIETATEKPSRQVLDETLTRIRFGRYDPLSTMTAMVQVNEDFVLDDDRYAVFQCIVRFVDPKTQELVSRVSTNRLPVALSVHDFLESSDEEAVPVVLGKEAVYRSIVGREEEEAAVADVDRTEFLAYEAQNDLDATVHRISGAFRLLGLEEGNLSDRILAEEGRIGASPSSLDFAFPPELADALHRLFHLRRGSLLSPGPLQSADDRAEKRSLFLRLPLDDCLCMMAPSLWSAALVETNGEGTFHLEQIPSDTLTLWDNRIIAADHHDTLFVWSGKAVLGPEYDAVRNYCKDFLLERSKTRFPMPHFHLLKEGDSMSRRFTARLAPSHADPAEHQMVHFPPLSSLSPNELTALREKFRFYDEATDASFRKWFWSVASASSNVSKEGLSLCE